MRPGSQALFHTLDSQAPRRTDRALALLTAHTLRLLSMNSFAHSPGQWIKLLYKQFQVHSGEVQAFLCQMEQTSLPDVIPNSCALQLVQQPLVDPIYLFGLEDSHHIDRLARTLCAVRRLIESLPAIHSNHAAITGRACEPYRLRELYPASEILEVHRGMVWLVQTPRGMRMANFFASRDGIEAAKTQETWAWDGNCAPKLVQLLTGLSLTDDQWHDQ